MLDALGAVGRPGVAQEADPAAAVREIATLLGTHRVWDRVLR